MHQERFDELAKAIATNRLSRRQVLKSMVAGLLFAGPLGALLPSPALALATECTAESVASCVESARQAFSKCGRRCRRRFSGRAEKKCLRTCEASLTTSTQNCQCCPTPSRCGSPEFSSWDETCLCIRSAEGHILRGKIPSTCDVRTCQTSADCADLGEGYFCDTPNSGCCPDGDQPRCIAPCDQPDTCAYDFMTAASVDAARTALAAGATDVKLSPQGCIRYKRTLVGGQITHEETTFRGNPALIWDHSSTESTGLRDLDLDGFFEWRATTQRSTTTTDSRTEISKFDPTTQALMRRETYARSGDVVHNIIEEVDASGVLQIVAEFDTGLEIFAQSDEAAPDFASSSVSSSSCSTTELNLIKAARDRAFDSGTACIFDHGSPDLAFAISAHFARPDLKYECITLPDPGPGQPEVVAAINGTEVKADPKKQPVMIINRTAFFKKNANDQAGYLWHEMLHLEFGTSPGHNTNPNYLTDRVYACHWMCFPPGNVRVDKCQCALCVGTESSDQHCAQYESCLECLPGQVECGDFCCGTNEVCVGTTGNQLCQMRCQPEELCGGVCCNTNENCINGQCQSIQKFFCPCNQTCYTDLQACLGDCQVTLGCFIDVCGEADQSQCP
jgi:hypothetical protein